MFIAAGSAFSTPCARLDRFIVGRHGATWIKCVHYDDIMTMYKTLALKKSNNEVVE